MAESKADDFFTVLANGGFRIIFEDIASYLSERDLTSLSRVNSATAFLVEETIRRKIAILCKWNDDQSTKVAVTETKMPLSRRTTPVVYAMDCQLAYVGLTDVCSVIDNYNIKTGRQIRFEIGNDENLLAFDYRQNAVLMKDIAFTFSPAFPTIASNDQTLFVIRSEKIISVISKVSFELLDSVEISYGYHGIWCLRTRPNSLIAVSWTHLKHCPTKTIITEFRVSESGKLLHDGQWQLQTTVEFDEEHAGIIYGKTKPDNGVYFIHTWNCETKEFNKYEFDEATLGLRHLRPYWSMCQFGSSATIFLLVKCGVIELFPGYNIENMSQFVKKESLAPILVFDNYIFYRENEETWRWFKHDTGSHSNSFLSPIQVPRVINERCLLTFTEIVQWSTLIPVNG